MTVALLRFVYYFSYISLRKIMILAYISKSFTIVHLHHLENYDNDSAFEY